MKELVKPEINVSVKKASKFGVGDKTYVWNVGMQAPLVVPFEIMGIIKNAEGIFYTHDSQHWVKEEYLHLSRKEAYQNMISQAESEMNQPESTL